MKHSMSKMVTLTCSDSVTTIRSTPPILIRSVSLFHTFLKENLCSADQPRMSSKGVNFRLEVDEFMICTKKPCLNLVGVVCDIEFNRCQGNVLMIYSLQEQ